MKIRKGRVTINLNMDDKCRWMDKCEILLEAPFEVLVRFVEDEINDNDHTDWTDKSIRDVKKEIDYLYKWWMDRKKWINEPNDYWKQCREILKKHKVEMFDVMKDKTVLPPKVYKKYEATFAKGCEVEKKREKEEDENLIRLMKIRRYLWT